MESTHFGQYLYIKNILNVFIMVMSTESLYRTSETIETPSLISEAPKRVNVDVLKQRLIEEKKKKKLKKQLFYPQLWFLLVL